MDYQQRNIIHEKINTIIHSFAQSGNIDMLLVEEIIISLETDQFIEDISFTSDGGIKLISFFKEKSKVLQFAKILPSIPCIRVWKVLHAKLKTTIPKEVDSFKNPAPSAVKCEHDRRVVNHLQETIKIDVFETKVFLNHFLQMDILPQTELNEIFQLIPKDSFFDYDATKKMYRSHAPEYHWW